MLLIVFLTKNNHADTTSSRENTFSHFFNLRILMERERSKRERDSSGPVTADMTRVFEEDEDELESQRSFALRAKSEFPTTRVLQPSPRPLHLEGSAQRRPDKRR